VKARRLTRDLASLWSKLHPANGGSRLVQRPRFPGPRPAGRALWI